MTKPTNTEAIGQGTGKPWKEWLEFLDSINARELAHKVIAARVREHGATGWWAQTITVAYEQHIGRREPGQDNKGAYSVSVTKTVKGTMDETLEAWIQMAWKRSEFSNVPIDGVGEVSRTDNWRYWRAILSDGTHVIVTVSEKSPGKVGFTVTHEKLTSPESVEQWRAYWKEFLTGLG